MSLTYLDYNSTTPVDEKVLEEMLPYFSNKFGNASSKTHIFGWEAEAAVELSRQRCADFIGAESSEIIFTSGATESINLALRGIAKAYKIGGNHIITCATEHKAVLDTCHDLSKEGFTITYLGVNRDGLIDLHELEAAITPSTIMVAIMMANNETGVIQDVEQIGLICRKHQVVFFSDITQAAGKIRLDVNDLNIDVACLSAHKFYGPKGVGALYVRRKNPRVKVVPIQTGGGHESGIRSGTLNVPGIVGLGKACEIAAENLWDYGMKTSKLRILLEQGLEIVDGVCINGSIKNRLPNTTNLTFKSIGAKELMSSFPDFAFSTGSACSSALPEPSHVLRAMGISEEDAKKTVRFSLGKFTTEAEIRTALDTFKNRLKN
jgi:cysteine desulfurase